MPAITAGQVITAAALLAEITWLQEQIDELTGGNPRIRARKSGSQTIPINTGTAVTFDVEDWDRGPIHSGSSSQFVAPRDGIYEGIFYAIWEGETLGFRQLLTRVNGGPTVVKVHGEGDATQGPPMACPWEIYMSEADYIEGLAYYEISGGSPSTLDITGASFTMRYVGVP